MTRIQDMTSTQRESWLVLLADGAVFLWFWQKMTDGFSPIPIHYDMRDFGEIVMGIIILTIILHVVISIVFEVMTKSEKSQRDERDIAIARRGAYWGYRVMQIGLGIIVFGILMSEFIAESYPVFLRFSSPVEIIFGLIVTSYVADLVKHGVMIHGYGR